MLIKNFYKTILTIPDMEVNLASESTINLECQLIDYNGNPVVDEEVTFDIVGNSDPEAHNSSSPIRTTDEEGKCSVEFDCNKVGPGYYNVRVNEAVGYFRVLFISGWQTLSPASGYSTYTSGTDILSCRRIEDVVEVRGVLKRNGSVAANTNWKTVATLPEGYRPHQIVSRYQQGSGPNKVAWEIATDGVIHWRYYGTTSNIAMPDTCWVNVFFNFLI